MTKTCGPYPGGLILTHTQMGDWETAGTSSKQKKKNEAQRHRLLAPSGNSAGQQNVVAVHTRNLLPMGNCGFAELSSGPQKYVPSACLLLEEAMLVTPQPEMGVHKNDERVPIVVPSSTGVLAPNGSSQVAIACLMTQFEFLTK